MEPTTFLPIVAIVSLVTVEYGGWALLSFISARERLSPFREQFFRAGHAHAGVLLVLSLVYFVYLGRTDFSDGLRWVAGLVLLTGVLAQSGGFFVHLGVGEEGHPSIGTRLTRTGALLIAAALVVLARPRPDLVDAAYEPTTKGVPTGLDDPSGSGGAPSTRSSTTAAKASCTGSTTTRTSSATCGPTPTTSRSARTSSPTSTTTCRPRACPSSRWNAPPEPLSGALIV